MNTLTAGILEKMAPHNPKKIYLQAPEGLKTRILDIAADLEKEGIDVIIGCDPTYGACDLRDKEALALGCDLLLHIGHSNFGVTPVLPVVYEPYTLGGDPITMLEKHKDKLLHYKTISLLTTIQFISVLEPATAWLKQQGKEVPFAAQKRNKKEGLLLGCDQTAALPLQDRVDCFLYIGSGIFHPLGLALKTEKPVFGINIETGEWRNFTEEKLRLQKIKAFHMAEAREAETFGILATMKEGQSFVKAAVGLKAFLKKHGKRAFILVMDEVTPQKIQGMKLDILVNCSCPRMDEDFSLFKKPILNPEDVYKLFSE